MAEAIKPTILFVEDPPVSREVAERTLPADSYHLRWASTPDAAIAQLQDADVELVIIDDSAEAQQYGITLLKYLAEKDPFERPAIVMTADPRVTMAVSCLKLGAHDYLRKPLDPESLRKSVEHVIRGLHFRRPGGGTVPLPESTRLALKNYRIEGILGEGRMGMVLAAVRETDDLPVAIKILKLPTTDAPESAREWAMRFQHEAEAISQIDHPNVIHIIEYGYDSRENMPFIVMDFIRGDSLEHRMRHGGCGDQGNRVSIIRDLALALAAVHEKGMLHRDVKPANVLISNEGDVVLSDFGVVRIPESTLTKTGHRIGSPFYMSPEACIESKASPASDLFSLGVIAYELLLQASPFRRGSIMEYVDSVQNDRPSAPRKLQSGFPGDLQLILGSLLEKRPADRAQSAAAIAQQLTNWLAGKPIFRWWDTIIFRRSGPWR